MIVDYVDVSSDEEVILEKEHVHGQSRPVHVKGEFIDLTIEEGILEEHGAHGQANATQHTSHRQEFNADVGHSDAALCQTTLPRQEFIAAPGPCHAAQCMTRNDDVLSTTHGHSDVAQHTTPQIQEIMTDGGQGDDTQPTIPQKLEIRADNGQDDAAPCKDTLHRLEFIAPHGQDATQCATTKNDIQFIAAHGERDAAQHTTSQRQESFANDSQRDAAQCTTTLLRQEFIAAHGQGNAAQCTITLHREIFPAAGDSMQEAMRSGNAAEATTSFCRAQQGSHRAAEFVNSATAPFPRQFWKAGEYRLAPRASMNNGQSRLRIHPKFLHSNATSHKWAFGAIAELLDNAIDEVYNGATFVKIDKMKYAPDSDYSLVIQDDGGGMSPESLRHCMSFGFSQKCTSSSIGQYGNGFKTSTMRLGADAIVFSCRQDNRRLTRSVGLLSYTFLMRTGCSDILVPVVDYEFDTSSSTFKGIMNCGEKHFLSNLSVLLRWSPFSTEDELLNQFNDMGCHGTKIIVFNLWFNDASELELDFITDDEDIMISGGPEIRAEQRLKRVHIANRFRYSLRVYASILYLHLPENFQIVLCGRAVELHHIANDLIYPECIIYRPQVGVTTEVDVMTTIGFLKGAPQLDIYGFNVYHRNRLILPFWPAGSYKNKRRGIAGVLVANFIRPTHDKQDFEKTGLFQRLEMRLKDMAGEYWLHHCHLIGYAPIAKGLPPAYYVSTVRNDDSLAAHATTMTRANASRGRASALHPSSNGDNSRDPSHVGALGDQMASGECPSKGMNVGFTSYAPRNAPQQSQTELCKRRGSSTAIYWRAQKRQNNKANQPGSDNVAEMEGEEFGVVIHQNTLLKAECSELEAAGQYLISKADKLRNELNIWRRMQKGLTEELQFYDGFDILHRGRYHNNSSLG
ncbi:hypothetical protein ACP70R_049304 [Stipagrostis hirtigluma subsp. patula]